MFKVNSKNIKTMSWTHHFKATNRAKDYDPVSSTQRRYPLATSTIKTMHLHKSWTLFFYLFCWFWTCTYILVSKNSMHVQNHEGKAANARKRFVQANKITKFQYLGWLKFGKNVEIWKSLEQRCLILWFEEFGKIHRKKFQIEP